MRLYNNSLIKSRVYEPLFLLRSLKERITNVKCCFSSENALPNPEKPKEEEKKLSKRDAMLQYLSTMPADVRENLFEPRKGMGKYKNGFDYMTKSYAKVPVRILIEKMMLINPSTAKRIAKSIVKNSVVLNSKDNQNKVVYDSDGMLCLTSMELRKQLQAKNIKSEITIVSASEFLKNIHPKELLKELDIGEYPGIASVARMSYETRLMGTGNETCMHSLVNRPEFRTWENPVPAYVYVGMSGYSTLQNFIQMYLLRLQHSNIFAKTRPEFFLLLDPIAFFKLNFTIPEIETTTDGCIFKEPKTAIHPLKDAENFTILSRKQSNSKNSILFRLFFDAKLVDLLPAKDFFPWKKKYEEPTNTKPKNAALMKRFDKDIALVQITPRIDPGIPLKEPEHLRYFFLGLSSRPNHLYNPVMPEFERWLPGFGLELIRKGYDPFTSITEIKIDDIRYFYNFLINHPEFKNSNFEACSVAQDFYRNIRNAPRKFRTDQNK